MADESLKIMPTLVQSSPLWTSYGELNNEEIEGLIIESQHLTELLQAELRLRGVGVAENFILGRDVRRKAEKIQEYGLTSSDRELIADANHLGMAVIRGGLNSAKHGLTQWKHISYTKLIWLVANVTTSAHALLLVIALGKNRLEKINLMERSRLVSFIKQHETTLLCPCLVPVARLPVDSLDMSGIATSSRFSHENPCDIQDINTIDISVVLGADSPFSPDPNPSLGTGPTDSVVDIHNIKTAESISQGVLGTHRRLTQSEKKDIGASNTSASLVPLRHDRIFHSERPLASNSTMDRVEVVLRQIRRYADGRTILSLKQEKAAFDFLRSMQNKLIYGVGIMVEEPTPHAWQLMNEGCQMMDAVLMQQSRSMIRLILRIFGGEGWGRFPKLRAGILKYFTSLTEVRLGRLHPLFVILSHLQDQEVFESTLEKAFLLLMDGLEKLNPADDEMRFLRVDLCFLLRERRNYAAAEQYGLRFLAESERTHGQCDEVTRGYMLKVGDIYMHQKLHEHAIQMFDSVIRSCDASRMGLDIAGVYAHRNLGWIYEELNEKRASQIHWKAVVEAALHIWGEGAVEREYFMAEAKESLYRQNCDIGTCE